MDRKDFSYDTGELRLHGVEGGLEAGPLLVLLHGATGRWQDWLPLMPYFEARYHVYALDLRGHGGSERAADAAGYHLEYFARDIAAFLRGRVEAPCLLAGHSWGALTALFAAQLVPERVRALVLEDPPLITRRENTESQPFIDFFKWAYQQKQAAASREAFIEALRCANPGMPADALESITDTLLAVDGNFLLAVAAPFPTTVIGLDFGRAVASVGCPALLLRGDPAKGGAIPDVDLGFFCEHAQRTFEVVQFDTGHGIHSDDPQGFLRAVERLEQL